MEPLTKIVNLTYESIGFINNPFFTFYLMNGILFFFLLYSFFTKGQTTNLSENEVLDYLEYQSNDLNLVEKFRKILFPNKGDMVTLLEGRWKDRVGFITKYNEEHDDYNIKVYKIDNPYTNVIPKRRIHRSRDEFIVHTDI